MTPALDSEVPEPDAHGKPHPYPYIRAGIWWCPVSTDEPEDEQTRPDWVSHRAVAWVIDDAPVPAELAWTLTVIARRCNKHGKGSRQTTKTIAAKAGKSVKQAQREIVRLRELGLIVLGDQSQVAHLPPGQRPTVYDVPLHLKGPKPQKESRNKTGLRKDGEPDDTPPMEGSPPLQGTPRMEGGSTPPMEGEPTPPMEGEPTPPLEGSQKKPLNNPLNNPSLSGHGESVPAPHDLGEEDRERDGSTSFSNPNHTPEQRMVIEAGCPEHLAAEVVDFIEGANPGIRGIGWWKKLLREGDLGDHVQVALASPPQCQRCEGKGEVWSETFGTMVRCDSCPTGPAALDRQPRSSQRPGFTATAVNVPEGTHTAKMERRREEHRQHSSAAARNWQQAQEIAAEHGHQPALADPWSQP